MRTSLFVASSTVAGLAGILFASRLGTARADLAYGFELEIITIVLLGGVSIFGGSGRMSGVALAILIVLNIRNGLGLAGVDGTTQVGVIGVILIASVLIQNALVRINHPSTPTAGDRRTRCDRCHCLTPELHCNTNQQLPYKGEPTT